MGQAFGIEDENVLDHYCPIQAYLPNLPEVTPLTHRVRQDGPMVTVADIRAVALALPRTTEHLIRDRVKFRVGQIVYAALSRDETVLGFGYPREEREALVASDPVKFAFPSQSDMRFQWVHASMAELDVEEMTELVIGAWTMCVPKKVIRAHLGEDYL